jgi:chemotaxis protein CheY-P-specific phosphatase CheC
MFQIISALNRLTIPMTDPVTLLGELERDVPAELSHIAMAKAANGLRQMVQHGVLRAVPSVEILTNEAASQLVARPDNPKLLAVQQDFQGKFSGRALLIFPERNSSNSSSLQSADSCRSKTSSNSKMKPFRKPAISFSTAGSRR